MGGYKELKILYSNNYMRSIYKLKLFIIIFFIIIIFVLKNKNAIYHFLILKKFHINASTNKNLKDKIHSDNIYYDKTEIENVIKPKITNNDLLTINTYEWKDIENVFDYKKFSELTNNYTRPILIKRVFNENELKNYNYNIMVNKYGNIQVEALDLSTDDPKGIAVTFKEYINLISNGKQYYLTINNSIANAMISDVENRSILDFYYKIFDDIGFQNIFIGNKNSSTHLHSELASSCALQLNGVKKWYIIDPKYSDYLHSIPDKKNMYFLSARGFKKNNKNINEIPHYEVLCEKGDFLFVPPWWWHEILNITDESIMLSHRPPLFEAPYKTNLEFTLLNPINSFAFSKMFFPKLVKYKIINSEEDTVIDSIKQIKNRIPDKLMSMY